jgi:SNF2 family DNA or RNA helicase
MRNVHIDVYNQIYFYIYVIESKQAAQHLMRTIRPILLQRKKCEQKDVLKLKDKIELVVWIPLASSQRYVYINEYKHV